LNNHLCDAESRKLFRNPLCALVRFPFHSIFRRKHAPKLLFYVKLTTSHGAMVANDVLSPVQLANTNCSVRLKLSAQSVAEFTALAQAPEPEEFSSELVGLLFGTVKDNVVGVETLRQMPVQAPGPVFERFTRKHFDTILMAARLDPQLEPLQLVGWYRFHLDCDTRLLPFEIEFHEKFFARHEHLGLILTADKPENLCISVCTRSQDGTFSGTQHVSAAIHLNPSLEGEVTVDLQSGPLFSETTYIKAYEALNGIDDQKKRTKWLGLAVAGAAIAGAFTGLFLMVHRDKTRLAVDLAQPLSLTLETKGPELLVSWTGGILRPTQARLRVLDGDFVNQIDVTSSFKPDQSLTIQRRSGNIQATLLLSDGYRNWETQSSLIAAAPPGRAAEKPQLNDAERAELNKLREENKRLRTHAAPTRRTRRTRR
jgi:hypothetical protein